MTKRKNAQGIDATPASGSVLLIPLNKLKKSPRNARKMPHSKADIEALAASLKVHGMLQNPVVEPEHKDGKPTGYYLVTIGEGRRQAQLLRVKRKEIGKGEPIRCIVETTHDAHEISLAENAIRSPMHPADQFEAFQELRVAKGMSVEDIAARFGVTPAVVKQRLKLAAISPVLMQAYRDEQLNLDQLTAFAISDDHARQQEVWDMLGGDADREDILGALNNDHIAADDDRALFVGLEAYQAAGGAILRDLFDDEHEGYLTDNALLTRLVNEKLDAIAATVKAEGWKWTEVLPRYDHNDMVGMRRVYPQQAELTEEQQVALAALEAKFEAIDWNDDDDAEEGTRIEQAMDELRGDDVYAPSDIARGGVIIAVGRRGEARIERGFILPEDDLSPSKAAKPKQAREASALPDKLVAELTAHRTLYLQDALGNSADLALVAVVHALAAATFFPYGERVSCVRITPHTPYLRLLAAKINDDPAAERIEARHQSLAAQMPDNGADLWDFIRDMETSARLALLAHCVSLTVDAVIVPKRNTPSVERHADQLADALNCDFASQWTPTAANYLSRVSKDRILEAVREGVSKEAADNLAGLKKPAMAEAAEQRLKDRRWLPAVLRAPLAQAAE